MHRPINWLPPYWRDALTYYETPMPCPMPFSVRRRLVWTAIKQGRLIKALEVACANLAGVEVENTREVEPPSGGRV